MLAKVEGSKLWLPVLLLLCINALCFFNFLYNRGEIPFYIKVIGFYMQFQAKVLLLYQFTSLSSIYLNHMQLLKGQKQ